MKAIANYLVYTMRTSEMIVLIVFAFCVVILYGALFG